jgi:Fusaric acid resistance protein-like
VGLRRTFLSLTVRDTIADKSFRDAATVAPDSNLRDIFERELRVGALLKAAIVIAPLGTAYFVSGDDAFADLSLIAISLLIAAFKLQLPPRLIALHLLAILVTLVTLFLAAPMRPLFVLLSAVAAFLASSVTCYGETLRTVGSWTFIPALYIACKLYENSPSGDSFRQVSTIAVLTPMILALVCAVQIHGRRNLLARTSGYGRASSNWLMCASASAIAVLAASALVEIFRLAQGQWLIWSAASVVVGDLATSSNKLKLRIVGASVGVPLGFLTGLCLPSSRIGYSVAAMSAVLTLVAFNRYVVGFGWRCFFIALAATLAGGGSGIPEERVINVLMGGAFGIIGVAVSEFVWKCFAEKSGGRSEFDPR